MIQKIIKSLNPFSTEEPTTLPIPLDQPVTVTTSNNIQVNPVTPKQLRMLRAALELSVTATTSDTVSYASFPTYPLISYDYSYFVVNTGVLNTAVAYLQISPDNIHWETQSATKTINPGTLVSFVPDVIAKYARLAYQSQQLGYPTTLTIYLQGR